MSSDNWYWDTCIFVAFLNNNKAAYGNYVDHIGQFLDDCKRGDCAIYTSTITIAEITQKHLVSSTYGSFSDFLNDFGGSIRQVIADPNVMLLAAAIRGLAYTKSGGNREMGTPDAIHLASALVLETNYGVPITGFHTFDDGKSRGLEGRSVPLLSYETWCESCASDPIAKRVVALKRKRPDHPNPQLPLSAPVPPVTVMQPAAQAPEPPPDGKAQPDAKKEVATGGADAEANAVDGNKPPARPDTEAKLPTDDAKLPNAAPENSKEEVNRNG